MKVMLNGEEIVFGGTFDSIPIGGIIIWSGPENTIPAGWHICDGTNGTVDLRGKFVMGVSATHGQGDIGGEEKHTLTVSEIPQHSHNVYYGPGVGSSSSRLARGSDTSPVGNSNTGEKGAGSPHNNLPPYLVLYYIQKISEAVTPENVGPTYLVLNASFEDVPQVNMGYEVAFDDFNRQPLDNEPFSGVITVGSDAYYVTGTAYVAESDGTPVVYPSKVTKLTADSSANVAPYFWCYAAFPEDQETGFNKTATVSINDFVGALPDENSIKQPGTIIFGQGFHYYLGFFDIEAVEGSNVTIGFSASPTQIDTDGDPTLDTCVWITEAGDDISMFATGQTNTAALNEFIGNKPSVTKDNGSERGLILVDGKLYWTKFKITAVSSTSVTQEFLADPVLIGPAAGGDGDGVETFTVLDNISQLPYLKDVVHRQQTIHVKGRIGWANAYVEFKDAILLIEHEKAAELNVYNIDDMVYVFTIDSDPYGRISYTGQYGKRSYTRAETDEKITSAIDGLEGVPFKPLENKAAYDALTDEEKQADIVYAYPDGGASGGGSSAGEVYSTEERVIGTWIDGRPIYERTFVTNTSSSKGWSKVIHVSDDIDVLVSLDGTMHREIADAEWESIHLTTAYLVVVRSDGFIWQNFNDSSFLNKQLYITVRWVKMADKEEVTA